MTGITTKGFLAIAILAALVPVVRAEAEPIDCLLFMCFGIGVGILFMQVLNKIGDPIPYTVVVFIAGILFSLANKDSTGKYLSCFV
jgi:hypothetical protein